MSIWAKGQVLMGCQCQPARGGFLIEFLKGKMFLISTGREKGLFVNYCDLYLGVFKELINGFGGDFKSDNKITLYSLGYDFILIII